MNFLTPPFSSLIFGFIFTFVFLYFSIPLLRAWFLDSPNYRSSHETSTPSAGGISFVIAFLLTLFFKDSYFLLPPNGFFFLVISLLPLAFVSLLDDYHPVPSSARIFVHTYTAVIVLLISHFSFPSLIGLVVYPLLFLLFIAVINFVNFMDGLDGLVASSMLVSFSSVFVALSVPWTFWVIIGSLFAFLVFNWSPSKVFMGDIGSTFLGAFFVALIFQSHSWSTFFGLLFIPSPLFTDSIVTIVRRFFARQNIFTPHRLHLYQRLHQSGYSHGSVSLVYASASLFLSISFFSGGFVLVLVTFSLVLLLGLALDKCFAAPFSVTSNNG